MEKKTLWHRITYLGVDEENQFEHREVVLLNKIVFMSTIAMFGIIPLEVFLNGWEMVPYEIGMGGLCLFSLILNYQKKFTLSKYYFFFVAIVVIGFMGVVVGSGSGNEFFMMPTFLFPLILFRKLKHYVILCVFAFIAFLTIIYLQRTIPPIVDIPMEIKNSFQYVFYTMIFILTFFEVYYFKSINYKFQELLSTSKKEIEDKNQEITDSINYAKRIQNAILPDDEYIEKLLPDSFVLYKPKDIVAGDFYWLEEHEGKVLFASADCTGHGVPGAMVSVVCDNALKKAVFEFGLSNPGKILDKTKELVSNQFLSSSEDVKDGMDIALCSVQANGETTLLEYSGANNPLWLIKKDSNELIEIKATKQPIGKTDVINSFQNHELELSKGDQIYIFSDGYADQFGGDKGKKFKYKSFKALLLQIKDKSMVEQKKEIDQVFESWKGDFEQLDDVCVIGVRI